MKPEQFIREWGIEYSRKYVALAESEGDILPMKLVSSQSKRKWRSCKPNCHYNVKE